MQVNLLIVDDQPANRLALKAILSSPGYRIVEAGSGPEALRHLLVEDFAALLIDVVMPGMSGFELATAIRQRDKAAVVPILLMSAQASDIDFVYKGYQSGAVDYLVKPLVPEMVRAKVAVFAELYSQRRQLEEQSKRLVEAERHESELRLAELRLAGDRRYRSLMEAVPVIIWTAGADGTVDYFNRRWFEVTGVSAELTSADWRSALHPAEAVLWEAAWAEALRTETTCRMEARLRAADGSYRWHLAMAVPERDPGGRTSTWLGTFTDIEDQKRAQAVLAESVQARDEFLSVASHELRSPLTTLQLSIEMLTRPLRGATADSLSEAQVKDRLKVAARQVDRLTRLVSTLMDVSRVEAGTFQLEVEEADLAVVGRDVVNRLEDEAAKAGCQVALRADQPVLGSWDRMRVEQVMTNLLENALKFGAGKPVELEVSRAGPVARIRVHDQGCGLSEEDAARIFERFERVETVRRIAGLGLGLFIVRQIVEAHRGSIRVDSRLGEGATFTVELPLREGSRAETHPDRRG